MCVSSISTNYIYIGRFGSFGVSIQSQHAVLMQEVVCLMYKGSVQIGVVDGHVAPQTFMQELVRVCVALQTCLAFLLIPTQINNHRIFAITTMLTQP